MEQVKIVALYFLKLWIISGARYVKNKELRAV